MDILVAASEAVPFCKTGGLADVAGSLTQVLGRLGHRVCLFLPSYRAVEGGSHPLKALPGRYWVPVGDHLLPATLLTMAWGSATVYLVQNERYFARDGLYMEDGKDYEDNDARFLFFSRAVIEGAKFVGFKPEVLHCHDWQAALVPAYLRTLYRIDAFYARAACVLTIHNLAYQGMFTKDALFMAGFGWSDYTPDKLEYYGGFNFLKAGLVYADLLSTVSPTYAREIQESPEFGRGLEGVLRHRAQDLHGILNGIDTEAWNPETDPALAKNYGPDDFRQGKRANKEALRKECGLADAGDAPLLGVVSRLDPQKGLDLLLKSAPELVSRGVQLVLLGAGDPELQAAFARLAKRQPGAVHCRPEFDDPLARRIYAGADIFLMPSRFEPCGLGQMIAMRYGALPVATRTGGLADTVFETPQEAARANGFVAAQCDAEHFRQAVERALAAYARKDEWNARIADAMACDHSWERSAARYLELYRAALSRLDA